MKKALLILFPFLFLFAFQTFAQNELTGTVFNKSNKVPVSFATIYIEDLRVGAVSDSNGIFSLKRIPSGTYVVSVYALGYKSNTQSVKIAGTTIHDFGMSVSYFDEDEVVVTGTSSARNNRNTPQPITEVSNDYLNEHAATNVIDAIANVPGVSAMTDGQSISKPFIRGLGYNRVLTVNDGVAQMDQPWFDEFGIEADPDAVHRVETVSYTHLTLPTNREV